jgi:serine protease Do
MLKRMQEEVAVIVRNARGAVVTIEDASASRQSFNPFGQPTTAAGNWAFSTFNSVPAQTILPGQAAASTGKTAVPRKSTTEAGKTASSNPSVPPASQRVRQSQRARPGERGAPIPPMTNQGSSNFTGLTVPQANMIIGQNIARASLPKTGTGFSIGDGYIVTTADVIEGMKSPVVITDDDQRIKAKIVGVAPDLNIGLIQLEARVNIPALKMGDSSKVEVGHFAISIGNQNGKMNSVSLAMVSGIRDDGTYSGNRFYPTVIQVAGTVGAGNSGAPLLNVEGEVMGIIAAVPEEQRLLVAPSTGSSGGTSNETLVISTPSISSAGFAVAINDIKPVVEGLRKGERFGRIWLGVILEDSLTTTESNGVLKTTRKVKIGGVYPDSPAQKQGLKPGDIMISVKGTPITSSAEVRRILLQMRPGDNLPMVVERGGTKTNLSITVEKRPEEIKGLPLMAPQPPRPGR